MKNLFTINMKRFLQLTAMLCAFVAGAGTPASAGTWELSHYESNSQSNKVIIRIGSDENGVKTGSEQLQLDSSWRDGKNVFVFNGRERSGSPASLPIYGNADISWEEGASRIKLTEQGAQSASSSGVVSITPVFRWKRNTKWNFIGGYSPDPDDNPPDELYYLEAATIQGSEGNGRWGGASSLGQYFNFEDITHPFGETNHSFQNSTSGGTHYFRGPQGDRQLTKTTADGDEARGETRTFRATIRLNSEYGGTGGNYNPWGSARIHFDYSAAPQQFRLDVSAAGIWSQNPHPTKGEYNAWASKHWAGTENPDSAITLDWIGAASYGANLSSELSSQLGNPTFDWTLSSNLSQDPLDSANVNASHFLNSGSKLGDGATSSAEVTISGNADSEILTASATINWKQRPYTEYRAEIVTEVINYDTGETTELDGVMSGGNALETEEERALDEFTTDYDAMKTEVVQTGAQLVGSALEAEMMVGSWFVPDEVDIATGGVTLAGKPLKNLYKVGKTLKATAEVALRINRVRDKLAGAVPAVRRKLGHGNFAIVMKRKKYRVSREGHLGPNGMREPAPMGELKEEEDILCNIPGGACFVKGTLVSTQNGLRAIETLQAQDLVWSRDAATGETQLKPIVQTFERYSTTLALTFSNGETIETTSEHPFYVAGRGFVKAGELGIGTSIVTRAGPTVALVAATAGAAQTVYNFEVADYHTYFVGLTEVWVHNQCGTYWNGTDWVDASGNVVPKPPVLRTPGADATLDKAETIINGCGVKINSGHGYNRPHTGPSGVVKDIRTTGLSMDQVENALLQDLSSLLNSNSGAGVGQMMTRQVVINGHTVEYRAMQYAPGQYAISTYYLL